VEGVTVKACAADDEPCASPLDTQVTDVNGVTTLTIPTPMPHGFEGYFELTGGAIAPMLYFVSKPVATNSLEYPAAATDPPTIEALVALSGATADPSRGIVATRILGCDQLPAAGFTLASSTADDASVTGYFGGSGPNPSATSTDSQGLGYVVGLPPGKTTLVARDAGTDLPIGQLDVWIRAGFLTEVVMYPTPQDQ
jgi:hypothetical protein